MIPESLDRNIFLHWIGIIIMSIRRKSNRKSVMWSEDLAAINGSEVAAFSDDEIFHDNFKTKDTRGLPRHGKESTECLASNKPY